MVKDKWQVTLRSMMRAGYRYALYAASIAQLKNIPENTGTAAVDGKNCYYNRRWCNSLPHEQLVGLIIHEALHVLLLHPQRALRIKMDGQRWDKKLAQIAMDIIVNNLILDEGETIPEGGIVEREYRGWSFEGVYEDLRKKQQDQAQQATQANPQGNNSEQGDKPDDQGEAPEQGDNPDTGGPGDDLERGDKPDDQDKSLDQEDGWSDVRPYPGTIEGAEESGKLMVQRMVGLGQKWGIGVDQQIIKTIQKTALTPSRDWVEVVRAYMQEIASRDEYSMTRPNKKYLPVYLPTIRNGRGFQRLAVAIDTSGSIRARELDLFIKGIAILQEEFIIEKMELIQCDEKIQQVIRVTEPLQSIQPIGGGRTDFEPVFNHLENQEELPQLLIYYTDLDGYFPRHEPPYPVIWVVVKKRGIKPPFGVAVDLI